jgi:hypothetical protein
MVFVVLTRDERMSSRVLFLCDLAVHGRRSGRASTGR